MTRLLTTMLAAALILVPPVGEERNTMTQPAADAAAAPRLIAEWL